jgi:hypothetical protein
MRESIFGRPRTNAWCVTFVLMQMDSVNGSTQVTMRHLLQQFLPKASSPIIPRVSEQLSLQVFEAFRHGGCGGADDGLDFENARNPGRRPLTVLKVTSHRRQSCVCSEI